MDPVEGSYSFSACPAGRRVNDVLETHAAVSKNPLLVCQFLCECDDDDCDFVIKLPVGLYREIRRGGYQLSMDGHETVHDVVIANVGTWLVIQRMGRYGHTRGGKLLPPKSFVVGCCRLFPTSRLLEGPDDQLAEKWSG